MTASRGLTLIEVLVALAIVAITLAAGVKAAGGMASSTQRLGDTLAAEWCADNQLTDLRLDRGGGAQPAALSVGDTAFTCEQAGRILRGQLAVRPTPNPNFRRVDAQVFDERDQLLVRITTVIR